MLHRRKSHIGIRDYAPFRGEWEGKQMIIGPLSMRQEINDAMGRSRLEAVGSAGLTPLIGREQEVALLRERWAQVKDGLGQVVLLCYGLLPRLLAVVECLLPDLTLCKVVRQLCVVLLQPVLVQGFDGLPNS